MSLVTDELHEYPSAHIRTVKNFGAEYFFL